MTDVSDITFNDPQDSEDGPVDHDMFVTPSNSLLKTPDFNTIPRSYHNSVEVTPMKTTDIPQTNINIDLNHRLNQSVGSAGNESQLIPPPVSPPHRPQSDNPRFRHQSLRASIESYELEEVKEYLLQHPECLDCGRCQLADPALADSSSSDGDEYPSPLHVACHCGCLAVVSLLITQYGSDVQVDRRNSRGQTALWIACYHSYIAIVSLLLNSGQADCTLCDDLGQSPLFIACARDNVSVINLLLKHRPRKKLQNDVYGDGEQDSLGVSLTADNQGRSVLFVACLYNHMAAVRLLSNHPELLDLLNVPDTLGNTPLSLACMYHYPELAKYLLNLGGVKVNTANADGNTPLHIACQRNYVSIAALLIDHGGDITRANEEGSQPLDFIADDADRTMLEKSAIWGGSGGAVNSWAGSCGYSLYMLMSTGLTSLQTSGLSRNLGISPAYTTRAQLAFNPAVVSGAFNGGKERTDTDPGLGPSTESSGTGDPLTRSVSTPAETGLSGGSDAHMVNVEFEDEPEDADDTTSNINFQGLDGEPGETGSIGDTAAL